MQEAIHAMDLMGYVMVLLIFLLAVTWARAHDKEKQRKQMDEQSRSGDAPDRHMAK